MRARIAIGGHCHAIHLQQVISCASCALSVAAFGGVFTWPKLSLKPGSGSCRIAEVRAVLA